MKMFLKIIGIILLVIIVAILGFFGYAWYRMKTVKDTHDLEAQADKLCNEFVKKKHAPGVCIGIIKGDTIYVKGYGFADKDLMTVPDGNTIFEIGSITKVFTASITQRLVDDGQLQWNDNIMKYLPTDARPPLDDTTTLRHLATHTSGFPRLPDTFITQMKNECDPYSTISDADFLDYLKHCKDKKRPNDKNGYDYSNYGSSLLARIVEFRTGKPYDTLLHEFITGPLQMDRTSLHVADSSTFATGYDEKGNKTCHWNFLSFYGAGAIRSNVNDMLKLIKANIDEQQPLYASFSKTHPQQALIPTGGIGYGWHIDKLNGVLSRVTNILWHNGGTGGFRTYMAVHPQRKTGIIVLTNQATDETDALGVDLMIKACITSFSTQH